MNIIKLYRIKKHISYSLYNKLDQEAYKRIELKIINLTLPYTTTPALYLVMDYIGTTFKSRSVIASIKSVDIDYIINESIKLINGYILKEQ